MLTDKIYQGSGTIDLLKDVSATALQSYLTSGGKLILGVDVNENEAGNESRESLGIAIKQMQLVITTTAGTFTFGDFWTSTTASIREAGSSTAQNYYTLFGDSGSSQITGGSNSDLGNLDDVVEVRNVAFSGTILSAKVNVNFLNTAKTSTQGNETFFDYSGGFEDFTLLGAADAYAVESANIGLTAAPSGITYTGETVTAPTTTTTMTTPDAETVTADTTTTTSTTTTSGGPSAPGAPAPPWVLLLGLAGLVAWKRRTHGSQTA